jgi:hypothetical protein
VKEGNRGMFLCLAASMKSADLWKGRAFG